MSEIKEIGDGVVVYKNGFVKFDEEYFDEKQNKELNKKLVYLRKIINTEFSKCKDKYGMVKSIPTWKYACESGRVNVSFEFKANIKMYPHRKRKTTTSSEMWTPYNLDIWREVIDIDLLDENFYGIAYYESDGLPPKFKPEFATKEFYFKNSSEVQRCFDWFFDCRKKFG